MELTASSNRTKRKRYYAQDILRLKNCQVFLVQCTPARHVPKWSAPSVTRSVEWGTHEYP